MYFDKYENIALTGDRESAGAPTWVSMGLTVTTDARAAR